MNMVAVTDLQAATRVELLDLDAMPHDRVAQLAARRELSVRDYGVWTILREHLWEYGSLPTGFRALAKLAGIGLASFERAAPKLARHFDRTQEGAWTDHVLMRSRGSSVIVPSPEAKRVNPALSAMRAEIGSRGGRASGQVRRAPNGSSAGAVLLQSEAKVEANGPSNNGAATGQFASPFAGLAGGWLVGSDPLFQSKTSQPTTGASEANPACPSEANGSEANAPDAAACGADRDRDARMVAAMLAACPGKIEAATAGWGLKAIKEMIAKGCSFEADYLPTLKAFAATNRMVKNVANPMIVAEVYKARDARLRAGGGVLARPDLSRASAETRALHQALETRIGTEIYLSWGTRLEILEIAGECLRCTVPTKLVKTWLEGKFARELLAAANAVQAGIARVALEVRAAPS